MKTINNTNEQIHYNIDKLVSQAHTNITRRKGKEYAPTTVEIQLEVNKIVSQHTYSKEKM